MVSTYDHASGRPRSVKAAKLYRQSCQGPHAIEIASTENAAEAAAPRSPTRHLTQVDVARRWRMSERTLEGWRSRGKGPRYLKLGGRIAYTLADIEMFERANARVSA